MQCNINNSTSNDSKFQELRKSYNTVIEYTRLHRNFIPGYTGFFIDKQFTLTFY